MYCKHLFGGGGGGGGGLVGLGVVALPSGGLNSDGVLSVCSTEASLDSREMEWGWGGGGGLREKILWGEKQRLLKEPLWRKRSINTRINPAFISRL